VLHKLIEMNCITLHKFLHPPVMSLFLGPYILLSTSDNSVLMLETEFCTYTKQHTVIFMYILDRTQEDEVF
jgi:hypothetical protein